MHHHMKMGLIFVDDINQSEVRKYEAKLTDCQSKLLAASNWANMFQEQTEQLQSELVVAHKDNEKLIQQIKAFGPKKDEPTAETTDTEKIMHALQVIHVKKETSTPPPSDHDTINQVLQSSEYPTVATAGVKRSLFKTETKEDSEETPDAVTCLPPQNKHADISKSKIQDVHKPACKTARLPFFKRKIVPIPGPEHATVKRKQRKLHISSNRLKSEDSDPPAQNDEDKGQANDLTGVINDPKPDME